MPEEVPTARFRDDWTYAEVYPHVGGLSFSMVWPGGGAGGAEVHGRQDAVYEAHS